VQRFSHHNDKSSKLGTPVKFPLTLDVIPYTTLYVSPETLTKGPSNLATPSKPKATNGDTNGENPFASLLAIPKEQWDPNMLTYVLSAVIVHKGEINSGHYVNYARKGTDWFLFDDSKVVLVDESEVLGAEAYLLVYVIEDLGPWAEDVSKTAGHDLDDD
jgi:ubiquitin carboxyl-terminal hydrolase 22/27/51